jgi:tyrosine-protein phosphatase YwqE
MNNKRGSERLSTVLASDVHGLASRPPILSKARKVAAEIVGEAAANALVQENPAAIVAGGPLPGV